MRDFATVGGAVLRRNLIHAFKNPALLIPSAIFPLLFFAAFAGGLSSVGNIPGFDFPSGYTTFQFVFVFLQSAAFGGVFTGFAVASDFESGFGRRLLLASPQRRGIVAGYVIAAICRWLFTATIVTIAALIAGMQIDGNAAQLVGLISLALLLNMAACLWGTGMALRFQTLQAGPIMQIPIFLLLFMAPVYVPLSLIKGWVNTAASYNPVTAFVEAGRGFISGQPDVVGLAYLCGAGLVALALVWTLTGLARAERGE
ncbi:MAG TPA: ABC transporter permease [Jatrophihabitantaceae bacterium]|jgi:ABC-2 type transport system permease protein